MSDDVSRRAVLMGAGGMLMAGAQGALPDVKGGSIPGTIDLSGPADNLRGFVRMMASMKEQDVPWWYNGTVYAVIGEAQNPQALFTFEGMELYLVTHLDDGTYELTGNTVTFFRNLDGSWLREYANPFTGKINKVGAAVQGGGPGRGFNVSVDGVRPTKLREQIPDVALKKWWSVAGDQIWMNNDTVYPPGLSAPRAQSQSMFASVNDFNNSEIEALPAVFSSTVTMPWLEWMEMGTEMEDDRPGHLLWHAAGSKLHSTDELPLEYRKRAEAEYPERMMVARK
jgi:hypothetical protein